MTAPIVGPLTRNSQIFFSGYPTVLKVDTQRTRYKQKRPYNLVLPAHYLSLAVVEATDTRYPGAPGADVNTVGIGTTSSVENAAAYNKAYARLKERLGNTSGMGITLAQYRQSMDMVTNRALQLGTFFNHLRKLRLGAASNVLKSAASGHSKKAPTLRVSAKGFANNVLETTFGWLPLAKDISDAVEVLQSPIPLGHVNGSASSRYYYQKTLWGARPQDGFTSDEHDYTVKYKLGCSVRVTNPNLYLANQLGFVNVASIAWDAVPFSFVVDWFANVGEFLSQFSDFAGVTLSDQYNTRFIRGRSTHIVQNSSYTQRKLGSRVEFDRSQGIGSGPILMVRKPWTVSPQRGLTAISLLLQRLR
jgi:hypothetical protein